jgi:hypothetical protein
VTNSKIVRHHVNGTIGEAERARLAGIAREGWGRNRDERLRSMERSEDSGRWLGLKEWMEGVLWENAGKPTASRDIHGDYATAQEYSQSYGIDWRFIAENFTRRGELTDETFCRGPLGGCESSASTKDRKHPG